MPTIRDIARAANLSKSTVALALRNDPRCAKATQQRIQKLARELGYSPNPSVAAHMSLVRSNRVNDFRGCLAWLSDTSHPPTSENPGGDQRNFSGARERAKSLGYNLEIFWYKDPQMSPRRLSQILVSRGIRGILVAPPMSSAHAQFDFPWQHFACATIGYTLEKPHLHRVAQDLYNSTFMVLANLRRLGYRRVGFAIANQISERVSHLFKAAYLVDRDSFPKEKRVSHMAGPWTKKAFQAWFLEERPDAVITLDRSAIEWIEELGYSVPGDVGIATMYHGPGYENVSGSCQHTGSLGSAAIDLIVSQINRNEWGIPDLPKTVLIPGRWVEGKTTRALVEPEPSDALALASHEIPHQWI